MSNGSAPEWVKPVMQAGYGARGVTYVIVGALAVLAAWRGGSAEGAQGALAQLRGEPLGLAALVLIGLGFLAYAVWRLICAAYDLQNEGHDAKGVIARLGQTATGVIHLGLGASVLRMAIGSGSGGGDSAPQSLTSKVLAMPNGKMIVMALGLLVVAAGLYYGYKGLSEKYKENIRLTSVTERLDPAVKAGLVAHGVVIVLIGVFLFYAGQTADPGEAGGVGKAFEVVRAQPFGRIMLGVLGLGTVGFAVYCFVEACYRVIPRLSGDEISTLASRAKSEAKRKARQAAH
ncbi:DUF1206 domain-containing protein [Pseudooceanicola sp.]|uniref:DUF1206 domain-containing protein n=1 Tax=Pseudooceanicola sp. TaxID=1914328 RepID=UPI0035C76AAC